MEEKDEWEGVRAFHKGLGFRAGSSPSQGEAVAQWPGCDRLPQAYSDARLKPHLHDKQYSLSM